MKINEGLRISGKITIDVYRAGMVDAVEPYLAQVQLYKKLSEGETSSAIVERVRNRITFLKEQVEKIKAPYFIRTAVRTHNLVMQSPNYGIDILIQRLTGNNMYSGNILWMEIGTGNTTPTLADSALTTPVARAAVAYSEDYGTTDAIVQAYFPDANLINQTYYEMGSFIDGTSSIGSGQLFNHALLATPFAKSAGEDLTLQCDFALSNS
jgi:hypothetical protein